MKKLLTILAILGGVFYISLSSIGFLVYITSDKEETRQSVVQKEEVKPNPPAVSELLTLVNKEREKVGVAPLQIDERLNQSAQAKADDMVKYDYFGHINPKTGKNGYTYVFDIAPKLCVFASENYTGNPDKNTLTSRDAVKWWMNSKPHHDALLDPKYALTGFGVKNNLVVEHFCDVP